jgi:hypothetical protein
MLWNLGFPHLGIIFGSLGIVLVVAQYKKIGPANSSLLLGASLASLLFSIPFTAVEWSQRMAMMSFLPGLIPLIYLVVRRRWGWILGTILLIFVILNSVPSQFARPQRVLSKEAYQELVHIKTMLPAGDNLVYAAHGLEWWVAWTMETDITNQTEIALHALDNYDHIFFVEQNDVMAYEIYHGVERFIPSFGNTSSTSLQTFGNTVNLGTSANHFTEIYRGDFFTVLAVKR